MIGVFGLIFGVFGFGVLLTVLKARRTGVETAAKQAENPEAPWLWRADWAAGKIEDSNRTTMFTAWGFATFWNLVSLPGAVLAVREALRTGSYGVLFVLIFPLVGLGLLVWALRATARYRRYGVSRFDLAAVPAPVGGSLRGTVVASGNLEPNEGLHVTLTCVRKVTTGSGKNRSTSERVLWQEEQRATVHKSRTAAGMASSIPIAFQLPSDVEPSDESNPRDRVIWRLGLTADVPGVDYAATFEVPVFRTAESVAEVEAQAPAVVQPFVQSPTSRVRVTQNRRGTEIVFPPARNPGVAAGLTVFLVVWLGAIWAMVHFGAPTVLVVIFAFFAFFMIWATLAAWLGMTQVQVGDGDVTVARGLLTPMRERRFRYDDIDEVKVRIGMQAGNTPFYDVVLMRKDGRKTVAGSSVRDKREAEWLAQTIRAAMGK
jgi:hypothetical protein